MRTAAGSASAADVLAPADARQLALFGAGLQAECHCEAMLAVRPSLRCVAIVNRSQSNAQQLAQQLRQRHPQLQARRSMLTGGRASHHE